ncbi:MAG: hypothetical protein JXA77_09240 [Bacteroidales bacterium]|nr:hypothetical protein [Bacteroidales bacterium]
MDTIAIPFSRQQRITNTLLLNASFIDNIGLMHGKMGIAIYFFHLARETGMQIYEDYAGELIDEIYEEVHAKSPCDFENGLAGIGWGIEYLVQNNFIDADTNEVLEESDKQIVHEITFHAPSEIGILKGITGYILYFLCRLNSNKAGTALFESIRKTLMDLFDLLKQRINTQLIGSNDEIIWNEPEKFDLAWDYPSVIWVLSELVNIQVCTEEAKEVLTQLVSPVLNNDKLPMLQSHQLLLAFALQKLKLSSHETVSGFDVETFLAGIEQDLIIKELADNSAFLRDGSTGIAFIFKKLFELTGNPSFKEKFEYWQSLGFETPESDQGYAGFNVVKAKEEEAFGILNGLAGLVLSNKKTPLI